MEDFKWLFFILGAVVLLVLWMWRNAFKTPSQTYIPRTQPPKKFASPAVPATSYQDILKEMQAAGERAKKAVSPLPKTAVEYTRPAEKTNIPTRSLERTETTAKSLESPPAPARLPRKSSAIELARTVKATPMATYSPINYGRLLRNPQNIRAAFVLTEVFNRRFDY